MALPWIKVDGKLREHPKTIALCRALGEAGAHHYLVDLWLWASQNEPSGVIRGPYAKDIIAHAAGWPRNVPGDNPGTQRGHDGDTNGKFVGTLVDIGWMELLPDGFKVHDWEDWAGAHIERARKEREKKARQRANAKAKSAPVKQKKMSPGTSAGQPGDVPATSPPRPPRVPKSLSREDVRVEIENVDTDDDGAGAVWRAFQENRLAVRKLAAEPVDPTFPAWWRARKAEGVTPGRLVAAHKLFCEDEAHGQSWATTKFMRPRVYGQRLSAEEPPPPAPPSCGAERFFTKAGFARTCVLPANHQGDHLSTDRASWPREEKLGFDPFPGILGARQ